jgi:hypothetical protein
LTHVIRQDNNIVRTHLIDRAQSRASLHLSNFLPMTRQSQQPGGNNGSVGHQGQPVRPVRRSRGRQPWRGRVMVTGEPFRMDPRSSVFSTQASSVPTPSHQVASSIAPTDTQQESDGDASSISSLHHSSASFPTESDQSSPPSSPILSAATPTATYTSYTPAGEFPMARISS